jgi:hypothetical protein
MTNFNKQTIVPFVSTIKMEIFKIKCYNCGESISLPVDWIYMIGRYPPRQLVSCSDCTTLFLSKKLPGVKDSAHRN